VGAGVLGLPDGVNACLFDLDGALTQTARLHAAAWKRMFDGDGKPRYDGVASFLASRGIELADGTEQDSPDAQTIHGLGNRKNDIVLSMMEHDGVEPYEGSLEYVRAAHVAGMSTAVVSSSSNAHAVLLAAGIQDLFEAVIDGQLAEHEQLRGKPAPDTYLAGARALGAQPRNAAVFEDALAGVEAGRAGRFGVVVGVDRLGQADALRAHGADVVVADLSELLHAA